MNLPGFLVFLCALFAASAAPSHAAEPPTTGKIVFSRYVFDPTGPLDHIDLYRVNTDGTGFRRLTPDIQYQYRYTPVWSPRGTWIAYAQATDPRVPRYDIHIVSDAGDQMRKLTTGTGSYEAPSWSPKGNWIAFRSTDVSGRTCVSVVRPDGSSQRPLFCPPLAVVQPVAPVWSKDGSCVYISTGYLDGEGYPRLIGYRVHVGTGKGVELGDVGIVDRAAVVYFSPGGARSLISAPRAEIGLSIVNWATGERRAIASGYGPVWSPDARRIAYSDFVYSQDGRYIYEAYVNNVDGSDEQAITSTSTFNVLNGAGDWSPDSRTVLVNRTSYDGNGRPQIRMYIVDPTTLARTPLAHGFAGPGAWYKPAN